MYVHQADQLQAEADQLAAEREPGAPELRAGARGAVATAPVMSVRLEALPSAKTDLMVSYRPFWLAAREDAGVDRVIILEQRHAQWFGARSAAGPAVSLEPVDVLVIVGHEDDVIDVFPVPADGHAAVCRPDPR